MGSPWPWVGRRLWWAPARTMTLAQTQDRPMSTRAAAPPGPCRPSSLARTARRETPSVAPWPWPKAPCSSAPGRTMTAGRTQDRPMSSPGAVRPGLSRPSSPARTARQGTPSVARWRWKQAWPWWVPARTMMGAPTLAPASSSIARAPAGASNRKSPPPAWRPGMPWAAAWPCAMGSPCSAPLGTMTRGATRALPMSSSAPARPGHSKPS